MDKHKIVDVRLFLLIFTVTSTVLTVNCGGGGESVPGDSQPLSVQIVFPEEDNTDNPEIVSAPESRTLDKLDTCRIIVFGGIPLINDIVRDFDIEEPKSISVPVGMMRTFVFIGQDINGQPVCRGETTTDINRESSSVTIGCDFVDEICNDGLDNDFDELIDCEDPDCDRSACDEEVFELECIDAECADPSGQETGGDNGGTDEGSSSGTGGNSVTGGTGTGGMSGGDTGGTGGDTGSSSGSGSSGGDTGSVDTGENDSSGDTGNDTGGNEGNGDCVAQGGSGNCGMGVGTGGGNGTENEGTGGG